MTTELETALGSLPAHIPLRDKGMLARYLTDFRGKYDGATAAVLRPRTTEEVAACVRAAEAHNIPLVPQAGNTSYCGGATPDASGKQLVISLERMSAVRELDVANRSVTVEAGIILSTLQDRVAEQGLLCPLSLGSQQSCQIGGTLSTNAGGLNVVRYGMARRMVLGLEVVLPDGRVLDTLAPLRKKNAGYDLDQLFIGAEGTLGIITAASLKLERQPVQSVTGFLAMSALEPLPGLLESLQAATGDSVAAFEYVSDCSLQLLLTARPELRHPLEDAHPHYVLFEVASQVARLPLMEIVEDVLAEGFEHETLLDGAIASSEAQRAALWMLRESLPEGESLNGGSIKHDVSVRVSQVPAFIESATGVVLDAGRGLRPSIYGHVGDGNIHFDVLAAAGGGADQREWIERELSPRIYDLVARMGGSFSAEYGLGQAKLALAERYGDPVKAELMRRVKTALDPSLRLNPGKVVR